MSADVAWWGGVDGVLLGVLLISVAIGLWRGLAFELASLAGWVLAWWVAHQFGDAIGAWLPLAEASASTRHLAGFAVGFVATLIISGIAARLMRIAISFTPLTLPDRLLGAGFGLVRGLLILLIATTLIQWTPARDATWWQSSRGAQWLMAVQQGVQPLLPSILRAPARA